MGSFALPDVTFYFFPKGTLCTSGSTTGATMLNTLTPDGSGVAHPSTSETGLAAGDYNFMAVVAGNANYSGATSNCEPFSVGKASLGINTTVHSDSPDAPLVGSLPLNGGAHDSATVTGKTGFDLPDVTFYFFPKGVACTNGDTTGATQLNTLTPDQTTGVAHPSTSETGLAAGDYNFMAVVAGNANYSGATSNCEPFTVEKAHAVDRDDAAACLGLGRRHVQGQGDAVGWRQLRGHRFDHVHAVLRRRLRRLGGRHRDGGRHPRTATTRRRTASRS